MLSPDKSKILIIRLSSLGDALLTTPVIRALKNKYPEKEFYFLVEDKFADAVRYNPNLTEVITYDKSDSGKNQLEKIKSINADFVIDLQNNIRSKNIVKYLKVPSVKFIKPTIEKFFLVKFKINFYKKILSIPEMYASALGKEFSLDQNGLDFYYEDGKKAVNASAKDAKKIAFCPGSQHFTKQYPAEYFIQLGKKLTNDGYEITLLGGKSDRKICAEISSAIKGSKDESNDNNLFELAREMSRSSAVVCNDSGLMHLAAAVGTPVAAIFGSTVKEFGFFPYKAKSIVIENENLSCRPCSHIGKSKCKEGHFKCMLDLTPEIVYEKLNKLLENKND